MSMYDAFKYFERVAELVADDPVAEGATGRTRPAEAPGRVTPPAGSQQRVREPRLGALLRLFVTVLRPHGTA